MERVSAPPQETPAVRTRHAANLVGALWMVVAMAGFTFEDALIKGASSTVPIAQILVTFGAGGALVFAGLARWAGESLFTPEVLSFPMRLRVVFEIAGRLFYVLALALIPLSAATVILQATPVVVVAAAALVFGEPVGWRRWSAILLGMAGVLVIIRPGTDSFSMLSLLAVAGMLGFAGRDLASRAAPATLGTNVLGFYGFLAVALAGVMVSFWSDAPFVLPETRAGLFLGGAVLCGVCAYACLMKAMRTGEVSAVTPFRYVRLIFGVALGVILFGERLTTPMLLGSAMIVLSGLFIMWRSASKGA
ncbi:DMT family transporter [Paracoccus sp. SSJ]|uniref:DMT family transporter n=1 Tax=Paracoccus sp. SSJ TaxID=3050636 RepID=UPI0025518854|nr:DMT family transporter [Paracoccus sp. SSJ]MDK8875213.1 DMT family transporter [Paracoccus sp. SSJ]